MTMLAHDRAALGYGLGAGEGDAYWLLGMLETVKISGADTNGEFGLVEIVVAPGAGSPWHIHPEEDEWFYVLDGSFTFHVGEAELSLDAGGFAYGPKGIPHTFIAGPGGGTALVGFAPFQFEGFLHEVGETAPERVLPPPPTSPPDLAKLIEIGARNGLEILGPPGPPPGRS